MLKLTTKTTAAFVVAFSISSAAIAENTEKAQAFYDLLSNPGSETHVAAFSETTSDSWESVGDYSGETESKDAFIQQIGGFAKLIPDLNWEVQEMHESGDFVTVRGRATGTPAGPFYGVDGEGRSFDIMSIDIHEFEDGKIIRTYHIEDWAKAMRQLSGQ